MDAPSEAKAQTGWSDLAGQIVDVLREKTVPSGLNLKIALELMTKLNAAMDAYLAYLAVRDGARYSTVARGLLGEGCPDVASERKATSAMGADNRGSQLCSQCSFQADLLR